MALLSTIQRFLGITPVAKSQITQAPYATSVRRGLGNQHQTGRVGARTLRYFADHNEWVRVAINRRKRQISQAKWHVTRIDDPKADAEPQFEQKIRDMLTTVNPKGDSLRSLLDQVVEDALVLDAGCIEIEKTLGGDIVALYPVDGGTIVPDPNWDGTKPNAPRYQQFIQGVPGPMLRNDQLMYIMANPRTFSPIGFSPVEALISIIEAELYSEQYDYDMMRKNAPEGMLTLGPGVTAQQRDEFANYYEAEIAGSKEIAIFGGGMDTTAGGGPKFIPFKNDNFAMREQYKKWLATKIASVFEMDLLVFNMQIGNARRATSNAMTARTDEGAESLARLIAEFMTRNIIWQMDPTHKHGFAFDDLNDRDAMAQAKIDQINMSIGITFPNEIRAREGDDPVPWGDVPYVAMSSPTPDPLNPDAPKDSTQQPDSPDGAAKAIGPFVGTRNSALMPSAKVSSISVYTD